MCQLSWYLGASTSWTTMGLSGLVQGLYYFTCSYTFHIYCAHYSTPTPRSHWRILQNDNLVIWLAVHHSITFLLLPSWYTNFLFVHINYIKLNSSICFERNPPIIRRSTTQIVHMQPLVSSLSAGVRLVQPLRKDFLIGCTRRSLAESDNTRGCICTICIVDLRMMSGLRSKHIEGFNFM